MKKILAMLALLVPAVMAHGQDVKAQRLSLFADKVLKKIPQIAGISVVVVNADSVLFAKGFGWANFENKVQADAATGFYIASSTKPFTAFLAANLAAQGKIDLYKPITEYAPFKKFSNKTLFKDIRIFDLLTHQSGLDNPLLSISLAYSGHYTQKGVIDMVEKYTAANKEGKIFEYTNFGYYLFSIILKEELGLDWRDLLQQQIFEPLKMSNTSAYMSVAQKNQLAMPYNGILSATPERVLLFKTDATMHAAGGIVSSAADMGNWLMFQVNAGSAGNSQLYPKEMLLMTQKERVRNAHKFSAVFDGQGYGLGWRTGTFKNTPLVYHFGGYTGFFCHLSFLPEKKMGVAVFVNHDEGSIAGNLIAEYAYDLYMGTPDLKKHEKYLNRKISKLIKKNQKSERKSIQQFAKRPWLLTLPKSSYAGSFANPELGTLTVAFEKEELVVTFGNMKAVATPLKATDGIRVELVPGSGSGIVFTVTNGRVEGFKYNGLSFTKQ
jgi:CubicO group peptidase (beta-lactamase class C family)